MNRRSCKGEREGSKSGHGSDSCTDGNFDDGTGVDTGLISLGAGVQAGADCWGMEPLF